VSSIAGVNRTRVGLCLAGAAVVAAAFSAWPRGEAASHYFEITVRTSNPGTARFYPDINAPLDDAHCQRVEVTRANVDQKLHFDLADGRYLNLRFIPTDAPATSVILTAARVVNRAGVIVRLIAPERIRPLRNLNAAEGAASQSAPATISDPGTALVTIELGEPLILKTYNHPSARTVLRRFIFSWFIAAFGALLVARWVRVPLIRMVKHGAAWVTARPARLILATAASAVVLSCYPVVFFGKSFLSPNNNSHSCLLYGEMPTVPGSTDATVDVMTGSDLGAIMWYSWPTSVVESQALFHDFELPLWNRYDSGGLPLLGQGQSMLGDPLHLLALLSGGSPFWWDLKYLLAKFIFAAALGLGVWQLTKHLPAAVFVTATSAFIGFFGYRYSHPAFFSVCYAPAVLLCWFKLLDSTTRRSAVAWSGLMVLANWALLNSGTVKEAYILLLALNACGLLTLLVAREVERKAEKAGRGLLSFVLFILIATPIWLTFLDTLAKSWTVYDAGGVFQLPPSSFVGLFDDIFYRHLSAATPHVVPSANFFILVAFLWLCASRSKIDRRHLSWGLGVTGVAAVAFVFGIVPSSVILHLPFIGRIYHVDNTFSCVAIVCLLLLAGFGVKAFCRDLETGNFRRSYVAVLVTLAGLLAFYFGLAPGVHAASNQSRFFWIYSTLLVAAAAIAPWAGARWFRKTAPRLWPVILLATAFVVIAWRHGMHLDQPFRPDAMNPQPRTELFANASAALKLIRERGASEPFRSVGLKYNFIPGYGGAITLEQIDGPDPLLTKHYKSLMDATGLALLFGGAKPGEVDEPLADYLPIFDMLNVRYVLGSADGKSELAPTLPKIAALDLDVYESRGVWPRAFFTNQVKSYGSESDFVALLKGSDGAPFAALAQKDLSREEALSEWSRSPSIARQIVRATDYALTTNTTSFKISAPSAGVVVLTEPYIDGDFQLRVNGRPDNYFRVNSAFRGVFVPAAGDYAVSFSYWPRHFTASLWISALGLFVLLLWLGVGAGRPASKN
jgi:hypothetical protein